ncbi:DNA-binding protein [Marinoscillum furvescens]|uniref:HTH domain-containing protein n=1 Tax=Marinoscillum furvescens DSM 4134 TaxID=1122208 RepID=A0A3D9KW70_MARFU|nr:DNA-binding protein [Marinoscillum furvescens]RED92071.1 hypothetical protein C7460_13340 [Marinoscillum furvescens DSM 4134]
MNFVKQIERIQLLNKLIIQESTGTPEELAKRLGMSTRQLYNLFDSLKCLGVKIGYNKKLKTYYYKGNASRMDVSFSLTWINDGECEKIFGGVGQCNFISLYMNTFESRLTG